MSKALAKFNNFGEFKSLQRHTKSLGKNTRVLSKHREVNTAGKTSIEIDNEVAPALDVSLAELNGIGISDPTNNLFLIRQGGVWRKIETKEL